MGKVEMKPIVVAVLCGYLALAVPVLLTLGSVRLVMTRLFLYAEYTRPGFPADTYGFSVEDRLRYSVYPVEYLLNGERIRDLGDLRFPDGSRMYNNRELGHMVDVKAVTQAAFAIGVAGTIGAAVAIGTLWRDRATQRYVWQGLMQGSLLTLGIIAAIVAAAVVNWDFFFSGFHNLFFESGTWRFAYSDTLIRLFPEQFWFDAALLIGGVTSAGAAIILAVSWRAGKGKQANNHA